MLVTIYTKNYIDVFMPKVHDQEHCLGSRSNVTLRIIQIILTKKKSKDNMIRTKQKVKNKSLKKISRPYPPINSSVR